MKFLCDSCERLAPASSFRVDRQQLFLTCSRCGAESGLELAGAPKDPGHAVVDPGLNTPTPAPLPSSAAARPAASLTAAADEAPRVIPLRSVEDAVTLAAEAAASDEPFAVPPDRCPKCVGPRDPERQTCPHCGLAFMNFREEDALPSLEVAEAFRAAMRAWDDPLLHEVLLTLATRRGELPAVGRLYRVRAVIAPMDPIAQRGRDEIVRRATAAGEAMREVRSSSDDGHTPRWQIVAAAIMLVGMIAVLVLLVRQLSV